MLFEMHNKAVVSSPGSRDGSSPGEMRDRNVAVVQGKSCCIEPELSAGSCSDAPRQNGTNVFCFL